MKLVKIVKLQRVRYGDLEEGEFYRQPHWIEDTWGQKLKYSGAYTPIGSHLVIPKDTDKYPPEVTYNIEGITADEWEWMRVRQHGGRTVLINFDESEIETRYI